MFDRLHIPVVGDLVVDVELEVGGRDGALAGAGEDQPVPGPRHLPALLSPRLAGVEPGEARPPAWRLHDAHHGVRRHRLELGGLRAHLALVEAAGGQREVEELDGLVVGASEAHLGTGDGEGPGGRNLPRHPAVELHVVLVPLDAVERLPGQVVVAPQLHGLVNLERGGGSVWAGSAWVETYLGVRGDTDISQ